MSSEVHVIQYARSVCQPITGPVSSRVGAFQTSWSSHRRIVSLPVNRAAIASITGSVTSAWMAWFCSATNSEFRSVSEYFRVSNRRTRR